LEGLLEPNDFDVLVEKALSSMKATRKYLKDHPNLTPPQTLTLLDSISSDFCGVIDAAELCRNVHSSLEYKHSAEKAFEKLSVYMHDLNADDSLNKRLQDISSNPELWESLTEEEKLFVKNMADEFESEGIHLQGQLKELAMQLRLHVVGCETAFSQQLVSNNIADASKVHVGPFSDSEKMVHLQQWAAQHVEQIPHPSVSHSGSPAASASASASQCYFTACTDRRIVSALLNSIDDSAVRKNLWLDSYHHPAANIHAFGGLLKNRSLLAKALGYESFAHKCLTGSALGTPEAVADLLTDLSGASKHQTLQELAHLSAVKSGSYVGGGLMSKVASMWGSSSSSNGSSSSSSSDGIGKFNERDTVYPWDLSYVSSQYLAQRQEQRDGRSLFGAGAGAGVQQRIRSYFPLDACIEGLQLVSQRLFGISLHPEPMGQHDGWSTSGTSSSGSKISSNSNRSSSSSSSINGDNANELVQKYVVRRDATGEVIGTVYMDLFQRADKFPGAAHFTVQCGCQRLQTTHYSSSSSSSSSGNSTGCVIADDLRTEAQLPVVALVFHFRNAASSSSSASSSSASARRSAMQQSLLSLQEVETLHHEWGHALHTLLSETKFQHLSGTRGKPDFVEVYEYPA
jgi:mitochondrial intermediate peptidase